MSHPARAGRAASSPDSPEIISTRGRFSLLPLLPEAARQALLDYAQTLNVPDGHVLYRQGDIGASMFCILEGQVRLTLLRADGRELVFVNYEADDCFGLTSLIDDGPLPHTAQAHGPARLKALSRSAFHRLRAEHWEFNDALLKLLCSNVRVLSDYVTGASLDDLTRRVASKLVEVAREGPDGGPVVRLSQTDMAMLLGVSRQAINRQLKQFEDAGLVRIKYGGVALRNLAGLHARAALE